MKALGLDLDELATRFVEVDGHPFAVVAVEPDGAETWADQLGVPFRRCYITDADLEAAAVRSGLSGAEVAQSKIPDPGSVMSGDFGEILASFYFAAKMHPDVIVDPHKWRYKADRTKAAPKSDVVQLFLPSWPMATEDDRVLCAEVKAKATNGPFDPIARALEGANSDREKGRLAKTLVWLRELAISPGLETVEIDQLNRFIQATDHPEYKREFKAVAVISAELVDAEIAKAPAVPTGFALIVLAVPDLKATYTAVFERIVLSADEHVAAVGREQ